MHRPRRIEWSVTVLVLMGGCLGGGGTSVWGAEYQWDFDGNLNSTLGPGILSYADASTEVLTAFKTTDGTSVPHIEGKVATYMHVPAFSQLSEGYNVELTATGPNGGGLYVNQYTMVLDIYVPNDLNWLPFFNTNPDNEVGNDADWYLAYDGSLGIAGLGYSDVNVVAPNTWYRLAFTADLGAGRVTYYVNGLPVFELTDAPQLDGRFSLYSNLDVGHDLRLFNEGDDTGQYTHELYLSSYYFADREWSASEILALGGPTAGGIVEAGLQGDYNGDNVVNAADFVVWRNTFGQVGPGLAADGNGNEQVDTDDYRLWKNHYGQTGGGGMVAEPGAAVPEPSGVGGGFVIVGLGLVRRRWRSGRMRRSKARQDLAPTLALTPR